MLCILWPLNGAKIPTLRRIEEKIKNFLWWGLKKCHIRNIICTYPMPLVHWPYILWDLYHDPPLCWTIHGMRCWITVYFEPWAHKRKWQNVTYATINSSKKIFHNFYKYQYLGAQLWNHMVQMMYKLAWTMNFLILKVIFQKKLEHAVGNFHEICPYIATVLPVT